MQPNIQLIIQKTPQNMQNVITKTHFSPKYRYLHNNGPRNS